MIFLLCSLLWAVEPLAEPPLGVPPDEQGFKTRVHQVTSILRCPTCQGVSIADSSADSAKAMTSRVESLVQQGYTDDQIIDYFVDKYGEWILLDPKKDHHTLWFSPLIFLVVGGGYLLFRKSSGNHEQISEQEPVKEVSSYREAILKELEED